MNKARFDHMCVVLDNKLVVFGGYAVDDDVIESYDGGSSWNVVAPFPYSLDWGEARCIVDRGNRVVCTSKKGLLVLHPGETKFRHYPEYALRDDRVFYTLHLN